MRIKRCSKGSIPLLSDFRRTFSKSVKNGPEIGANSEKCKEMVVQILDFMFETPKRHILARNRELWRTCVKIRPGALAAASCKTPQNEKKYRVNTFGAQSRMRGNETLGRIVANFCTGVGAHYVSPLPFCRAMLCKRGLCCHAVCVCLSVCCVRLSVCLFVYVQAMLKITDDRVDRCRPNFMGLVRGKG